MKEQINPRYKAEILRAMEYHFPGAKIILFGSRARGTHEEGADVDIAVDARKKVDRFELARARNTLDNLLIPLDIDLVDMHRISESFRDLILQEGVVWKNIEVAKNCSLLDNPNH